MSFIIINTYYPNKKFTSNNLNYFINIIPNKMNSTIMSEDSDIGMMKKETIKNINNLGIIAKWNIELSIDLENIEAQLNHFIKIIPDKVNYFIKIIPDKANLTTTIENSGIGMMKNENSMIMIKDSGIGMMKNEIIYYLGIIVKWS